MLRSGPSLASHTHKKQIPPAGGAVASGGGCGGGSRVDLTGMRVRSGPRLPGLGL